MPQTKPVEILVYGRMMYPHVHEPHSFGLGKPEEYRASIVLDSDSPEVAKIHQVGVALVEEAFGGQMPTADNYVLKRDTKNNPLLQGKYIVNARSESKPHVVDRAARPIMDASIPADGDWCYFQISLFSYSNSGNRGISAFLNGVMFDKKGEGKLSQGGKPDPDKMFAAVVDKSAALPSSSTAGGNGSRPLPNLPF